MELMTFFLENSLNSAPYHKMIFISSFLYPAELGFTIWNLTNMVLSQLYSCPIDFEIFNANVSMAVMMGSLSLHLFEPVLFNEWVTLKHNSNIICEKIVHITPVIYYWSKGIYKYSTIKISGVSFLYNLIWGYRSTGSYNMQDIYFVLDNDIHWLYTWSFVFIGHIAGNTIMHVT